MSLMTAITRLTAGVSTDDERCQAAQELTAVATRLKLSTYLEGLQEAISDSRDGVYHVSRIVRAMKEFAHPGQEAKTSVDINRALESTIAVSTNEWKYVAEIETHFDPSLPSVTAHAVEINQVFLNILVNAAHAVGEAFGDGATEKGKISVSSQAIGENVLIAISDTGAGIPEDIKQRIFDPFFTTKDVGKGTGQGLSIAHSVVVKKHGGRLWCAPTSGGGTTFFVQIPIKCPESPAEMVEAEMTAN